MLLAQKLSIMRADFCGFLYGRGGALRGLAVAMSALFLRIRFHIRVYIRGYRKNHNRQPQHRQNGNASACGLLHNQPANADISRPQNTAISFKVLVVVVLRHFPPQLLIRKNTPKSAFKAKESFKAFKGVAHKQFYTIVICYAV